MSVSPEKQVEINAQVHQNKYNSTKSFKKYIFVLVVKALKRSSS